MARGIKILAQGELGVTSFANVYTVPTGAMATFGSRDIYTAVVSSLVLCNRHSGTVSYNVRVVPSADTAADRHIIFNARDLTTNATDVVSLGMGLVAGDEIDMFASVADKISVTVFGIESV